MECQMSVSRPYSSAKDCPQNTATCNDSIRKADAECLYLHLVCMFIYRL